MSTTAPHISFKPHVPPKSTGVLKSGALRLAYGQLESQFGDLRLPPGPGPHRIMVLVHGGAWRAPYHLDQMDLLAEDLTARSFATWNVEYRRVGQPGGGWPGTFHDVSLAADHLREMAPAFGLDLTRVIAIGHSAGGHLALWLAARHRLPPGSTLVVSGNPLPLAGVIAQAGIPDLRRMWEERPMFAGDLRGLSGGNPSEVPDHYAQASPITLLPLGVPQVLVHGTEDKVVPIAFSRSYVEAAKAAGDQASLIELPGVDHFAVLFPDTAPWAPTVQAIMSLFGPPPGQSDVTGRGA